VDTEADKKIFSENLAQVLQLEVTNDTPFLVEVGTGQISKDSGFCEKLDLVVQGVIISQPFFLLNLGNIDVVLGMTWIASLGEIKANFQKLVIR